MDSLLTVIGDLEANLLEGVHQDHYVPADNLLKRKAGNPKYLVCDLASLSPCIGLFEI